MNEIGIIILAAGASKRLGEPKQLVKFQGDNLIDRAIKTAINTNAQKICVVLGANSGKIKTEIKDFPVQVCVNENWQSGMASSLNVGLENLLNEHKKMNAILIMLCDQPFITDENLNLLINTFNRTDKPIIVSSYKKTLGVPAIFSAEFFDVIRNLKGEKGAKSIINKFPHLIEKVSIPEAEFDIDTQEDLSKLQKFQ